MGDVVESPLLYKSLWSGRIEELLLFCRRMTHVRSGSLSFI